MKFHNLLQKFQANLLMHDFQTICCNPCTLLKFSHKKSTLAFAHAKNFPTRHNCSKCSQDVPNPHPTTIFLPPVLVNYVPNWTTLCCSPSQASQDVQPRPSSLTFPCEDLCVPCCGLGTISMSQEACCFRSKQHFCSWLGEREHVKLITFPSFGRIV